MNQHTGIGCQGWVYKDWVTSAGGATVFYPTGTRDSSMLEFYAKAFRSVEVDSTFYALPSESAIENWIKRTPDAFTFSPKLLQEITHNLMLEGAEARRLLDEFTARIKNLKNQLGIVLIQLPPQFTATSDNFNALKNFLPLLDTNMKWSVEFRAPEWMTEETSDLLRQHKVAPCLVEGNWIRREALWQMFANVNTDFAYIRWMGKRDLTRFDAEQRARDANLELWAKVIKRLSAKQVETFAYFSNYYEGHAPSSANKLRKLTGEPEFDARELETQPSLF